MIVADAMRGCEGTLALDARVIGSPRTGAGRFDAWLRSLDDGERLQAFCVCSRLIRSAMDQGATTIVDDWTWQHFWMVCAVPLAGLFPDVRAQIARREVTP